MANIPQYPHQAVVLAKFKQRGTVSDHYMEVYTDSDNLVSREEQVFSQISLLRSLDDDHSEPAPYITISVRIGR